MRSFTTFDTNASWQEMHDTGLGWENRARDAEHEAHLLEDRLQTLGYEHRQLEQEFTDLAANAQWLADILKASPLAYEKHVREALDARPGVSLARRDARERLAELSVIFELPYDADVIGHVNERCSTLRCQAEGGAS